MNSTRDHATPERREYVRDHYADARAAAIAYLGSKWRGRAGCEHEYIDSRGERTQREPRT